jgi:tetratricopeptide (TPR) repeat protein
MHDLDRAITDFNQMLEIDPGLLAARRNRGSAYGLKGDYVAMLTDFGEVFAHETGNGRVTSDLALTFARMGDYPDAIGADQFALALNPTLNGAYNNLAWLLATCPDTTYRDGKEALTDATQACKLTGWSDSISVDTFAAACAAAGDFDAAVKWERASLALPGLTPSDLADAQKRLALYQSHQPYQEDPTQFLGTP